MLTDIKLNLKPIGVNYPPYFIAELSANHNQSISQALKLVDIAADCGADAIKLQTYTPDSLTLNSYKKEFYIPSHDGPWSGQRLWELYSQAYTPWEWHETIFSYARERGLGVISTAFDEKSVDFLLELRVDALKIASFELINIPLIKKSAETGVPVIISTGMGTLSEIEEAVETVKCVDKSPLILLKCTSAYPSKVSDANLNVISDLRSRFRVPVGLSDHTMTVSVAAAATALRVCVIEKHLTLSRDVVGPDSGFSLEPAEFKNTVQVVRETYKTLGKIQYGALESELTSVWERPSIWVTADIKQGDIFTQKNLRIIRPSGGLHPREFPRLIGMKASIDIEACNPLLENHILN